MATKAKVTSQAYHVSFALKLNIGFNIEAESMAQAVEKAQAMKVVDIVDFDVQGWDHEDSDTPVLTSVMANL